MFGKGGKGDDEHHDDHDNASDKGPHGKMEHPHEIGLPNRLREIVLEGGPNVEGLNPASFKVRTILSLKHLICTISTLLHYVRYVFCST